MPKKLGSIGLALVFSASIISALVSGFSPSWWNKDLSYPNDTIASSINQANSPLLMSDRGDYFTNKGDLISLSYRLKDNVDLLLFSSPSNLESLNHLSLSQYDQIFVFRPSIHLQKKLTQQGYRLEKGLLSGDLWQFKQ